MSKCPCCGNELVIVEGSVKFLAQLGESKNKQLIDELDVVMEE